MKSKLIFGGCMLLLSIIVVAWRTAAPTAAPAITAKPDRCGCGLLHLRCRDGRPASPSSAPPLGTPETFVSSFTDQAQPKEYPMAVA